MFQYLSQSPIFAQIVLLRQHQRHVSHPPACIIGFFDTCLAIMRLVVQGSSLQADHLEKIRALCGNPKPFIPITPQAFYLPAQQTLPVEVASYAQQQNLDCTLVKDAHTLQHFGLAVMDMDSTLINIECIDEIADMYNLKPQVAAITESAMRGEIEFAESLRQRVALLKGLDESALHRVVDERLQLNPGAHDWITACKKNGIKTMLVSGGFDFFAERVQALLGLDYAQANSLEIIDGKLTGRILGNIVDAQAKADFLISLRDELGLAASQTVAIGDGANDLKMMAVAACGVAYHAKPIVQSQASYALNHSGLDGITHLFSFNQ
ncbi:phosphoserine phosphatase SerB [Methylovorus sp. MM2]|uniref:phosphoserine phosphatase SerB n=1 Tax=Methylovorus sp. MM2 TaxID=1848038 RepID=UPI00352E5240